MNIRIINGYGPLPSPICLIGERPGKVENSRGRPFVGPSGEMLNDYLLAAGIDRSTCYATNTVRTYSEDDPTDDEIERDKPVLKQELLQCRPRYIGLLGKFAVKVMLPAVLDYDQYWGHGLMFMCKMPWGWVRLMPLYHPAAGMHQTSIQGATAWDFEQFGRMVRGESVLEYRHMPQPGVYREAGMTPYGPVAIDTEGSAARPWCLSYSNKAGEGWVVRVPSQCTVDRVILHHSLHDLAVLAAMGVRVTAFADTMVKAALLGVEPMGLKDLARRHLGMRMQSYSELVAEAGAAKAVNWIGDALVWLSSRYPEDCAISSKVKVKKARVSGGKTSAVTSVAVPF